MYLLRQNEKGFEMARLFTLEELENRWKIPYEILFKMLFGFETGVFKNTDIFSRISLPYFGREIKGSLNFRDHKKSSLTFEEATNFAKLVSQAIEFKRNNFIILIRIAKGDKQQLLSLMRKNLKWYLGLEMDVIGTIKYKKSYFVESDPKSIFVHVENVIDKLDKQMIADHIWVIINNPHEIKKFYPFIYSGTKVSFTGTIIEYFHNGVVKYGMKNIKDFKVLSITERQKQYLEQKQKELDEKLYCRGLYKKL